MKRAAIGVREHLCVSTLARSLRQCAAIHADTSIMHVPLAVIAAPLEHLAAGGGGAAAARLRREAPRLLAWRLVSL